MLLLHIYFSNQCARARAHLAFHDMGPYIIESKHNIVIQWKWALVVQLNRNICLPPWVFDVISVSDRFRSVRVKTTIDTTQYPTVQHEKTERFHIAPQQSCPAKPYVCVCEFMNEILGSHVCGACVVGATWNRNGNYICVKGWASEDTQKTPQTLQHIYFRSAA